jgi:formylglycine-generating enzyme required for sulfatase activity
MLKINYEGQNSLSTPPSGRTPRALHSHLLRGSIILTFILAWCVEAQAQRTASAVATVANGSLATITITDGGAGYVTPPIITLLGGGGTGASASALVTEGVVMQIIILTVGNGFTTAPTVVIDPPPPAITPATLSMKLMPALIITGPAQEVQEIQYADALGNTNQWFSLTNIVLGDAPFVFVDATAPVGSSRLYRSVALTAPGPDQAGWAWIPPGSFIMGSPLTEHDRSTNESPQTVVTISKGYWMKRYEVTQGEYTSLIGTNPATFTGDMNQPVEQVSWYDAYTFCARLTVQERAAGRVPAGYEYRLPTEAEWEYAARAGTTTSFSFGDDPTYTTLPEYAWFNGDSNLTSHDVGTKKPNPWGLYDMAGNVWEWCEDWYAPYAGGSATDPTGPFSGSAKVMRGGSWHFAGGDARSADRNFNVPDFASFGIGIRVVLAPTGP